MAETYSDRLRAHLARYARTELAGSDDLVSGTGAAVSIDGHVLPAHAGRANLLPGVRDAFWSWFDAFDAPITLRASFNDLSSSQAALFNLFFPFLDGGRVDPRLIDVLGIRGRDYTGAFEKILDDDEGTPFDFVMAPQSGPLIVVDLKLAENHFGQAVAGSSDTLDPARRYRDDLRDHVDAKWLAPPACAANDRVLRNLACLGRRPQSGALFIFPRANESLKAEEQAVKQIVSKSLAPRVAILYLEYLVERILKAVADDSLLHDHFLRFRAKYICL